MREYDDERELMGYVWRNYPQIVRPHECVASAEQMRDAMPEEFREEYWEHAIECRRLVREAREAGERLSMDISPTLPVLREPLLSIFLSVHGQLQRQAFRRKLQPHLDEVVIHRCAHCQKVLYNEKTRQCLWCGSKWH